MNPGYPPPPSPLGALVKHYGRSRDWTLSLAIGSSLALGGSIAVPLLTMLEDTVDDDTLFWMYVGAPFGILVGLAGFIALLVHLGQKLDLHQLGLVHRGKRVVRWEEIESISSRIYEVIGGRNPGTRGHVTLRLRGGGKLKLTPSLDQVADARAQIEGATFDGMMAAAQAAIASGRPAAFGPLWVSPQGLGKGGEVQPWAAFSKIEYEEGKFIAVTQGPFAWVKLRRDKIPNIHVFLPLVAQFHDVRGF
jgi:hypothetical protein